MKDTLINIRHLRAVLAVIDSGSVSAATQIVNLTQPAITQGLALIEQRIGLPLFYRKPNGMQPTQAAMIIAPRLRAAMKLIPDNRITSTQMQALLALADAGSYRAAAQNGSSEASLHRAISDLAATLDTPLVERRGRGVSLTPKGLEIARLLRLAQTEIRAASEELEQLRGANSGQITVGAMPLSRARILPAAVVNFHRQHPNVNIRIIEGSRRELVQELRQGRIDLLVGALRLPSAPEGDVSQDFLFDDRPVIIGRAGHPLAQGKASLEDLRQYNWVLPAKGAPLRDHWEQMFADKGLPAPRVPVECGAVIMIRQILLAGDFLTVLSPDQLAVELASGLLVKIAEAPQSIERHIGITTRKDWSPTSNHLAMIAALKDAQTFSEAV